ncbi:regulatory protein [Dyadobacter sp. BE34]|uniref:Regulatory protein RecX n=1 Tax=Dyadobacter fermentans TaxID=94254 RepID=A0ABU1R7X8_9BACT|nr:MULTISPECIES: regulatory protein RecX [Dyadobacter]MDR6809511.1 regulatory protein [Dyadobacter fermentans]MDR7047232.1 regulatory protein [Dyadobacter sp. BE242]MDR7201468.1 regulatory protein [Dyadobacter sp. BE34]MDR7219338.1 regulatory protein [Dyadobacter sp. BE31]MDR7267104.1 regulatory protein [Dyadobacter sp. BE32]
MDRLILQKAASYCAYQERTQDEVKQRLKKWNVWGDEADEIIAELISMNYLSEERFAKTYAGGKFRVKNWGRMKIRQELNRRGLSTYSIEKGMNEIGDEDYLSGLRELLSKKRDLLSKTETDPFKLKQKLARFAMGKGYESELVWKELGEL